MNKLLKSTLIAGGVMGAFFASEANAQSFNVVVNEIELVSDADNYIATANTVYKPSVGMGAATTTTVDFFNTSSNTFSLTKPVVGNYESMVVHFDTAEVSGATTTLALSAAYPGIVATYGGRSVMTFGQLGAGGASVGTVSGVTTAIPMQPVVVTSTAFTIPEFNWNLPVANVNDAGGVVSMINGGMDPFTLARNVDSSTLPNFMIDVDPSVFDGVTGFTSGTSNITVGLFADTDLGPRPMFRTTFTPSNQATNNAASRETVTFYDVPEGTVYPVAWFDADNDKLLDQGEFVTMHSLTVATAAQVVAAADISYTATAGILDETATAFGYRGFSMTIPMPGLNDVTSLAVADVAEFNISGLYTDDIDTDLNGTTAAATSTTYGELDITYELFEDGTTTVTRVIALDAAFGEGAGGNGDGTHDTNETAHVVVTNASADNIGGVVFTGTATNTLVISDIPYTALTTVSAENVGEYSIAFGATYGGNSSAASVTITEATETPLSGSITVVVADGDASDTDGIEHDINLGTF